MVANALRLSDRQLENPAGQGALPVILAFLLPILTVVIWGEAALRVVAIYVRRNENREEWDRMVAKTFSGHIVIFGIGKLSMAMFRRLVQRDPDRSFVLVDVHPDVLAEAGYDGPNISHLQLDIASPDAIQAANCAHASLVIICSGDDAANLEAAYKVLEASPNTEIWVRLYHSGLASFLDKTTWRNVHFFSPYERAADAMVGHLVSEGFVRQQPSSAG
jgi:voltage-gated potassium channel Kch